MIMGREKRRSKIYKSFVGSNRTNKSNIKAVIINYVYYVVYNILIVYHIHVRMSYVVCIRACNICGYCAYFPTD